MQLLGIVHTTDQGVDLKVCVLNQLFRIFTNLYRQLAGRRQDQRSSFTYIAFVFDRVFEQVTDNTDQECSRFTRTCLCLADHVMAAQGMRQRSTLNRCAVLKSSCLDTAQQRQWQIEIVEAGFTLLHFDNKLICAPGLGGAVIIATTAASATSRTS